MTPEDWWEAKGSGITPRPLEDFEEHTKRVAIAAYKAGKEDKQ